MDGLWTGVRPVHLYNCSQMVSKYSGMLVQPNKAIVGANAFSHESGMHQDGMLKHRETYQIMSPETIGLQQKSGDPGMKGCCNAVVQSCGWVWGQGDVSGMHCFGMLTHM
jgi:2-isopropylmalate synthase